jgi:hypothetical protein
MKERPEEGEPPVRGRETLGEEEPDDLEGLEERTDDPLGRAADGPALRGRETVGEGGREDIGTDGREDPADNEEDGEVTRADGREIEGLEA